MILNAWTQNRCRRRFLRPDRSICVNHELLFKKKYNFMESKTYSQIGSSHTYARGNKGRN